VGIDLSSCGPVMFPGRNVIDEIIVFCEGFVVVLLLDMSNLIYNYSDCGL